MLEDLPIKQRRRIWKFIAAGRAFMDAKEALYMLMDVPQLEGDLREAPLWTALVTSYGRPFTHNNDIGPIPDDLVPREMIDLHRMLMAMRNKFCGHTDYTIQNDTGGLLQRISLKNVAGNIKAFTPTNRPSLEYASQIEKLCVEMMKVCDKQWRFLLDEAIGEGEFPEGKFVLNIVKGSEPFLIREKD